MFMVLPAAVLFATVFSIGAFTRHAELTAAKASGISFYRMILPIFVGALFACGLDLGLGEVVADHESAAQRAAAGRQGRRSAANRYNFAFAGEYGRVYKAYELRTGLGSHSQPADRAKGLGPDVSDLSAHGRFGDRTTPTRAAHAVDARAAAR